MSEPLKTVAGLIAELEQYPQDAEIRSATIKVRTKTLNTTYTYSALIAKRLQEARARREALA